MVSMADQFTDLHCENDDEESEIIGCNRCSLMMSFIDDRLRSFFSVLTNKIKQAEVRLDGLNVLSSNVEEMKEFLKLRLDRLDNSGLKEEGAGGKKRGEQAFSVSPKAGMSQQRINANTAFMLTPKDKRPALTTTCEVDMGVDAAEELSIAKANAEAKVNKRTHKPKRK